ncbi:MAG: SUMF1/EgtB/PvdO family nonheme iron enzyme [Chthoniobacteraceae bacterium]
MPLPNPIPDNPHRWEGWKDYNSDNPYARLCLSFDSNPTLEQIEDNCRQLLVWWQKKLPLKSQPSNPLAQLLRGGLDEAPKYLAEAKTVLLDPAARARVDAHLHQRAVDSALGEFKKLLSFALSENQLSEQDEERLNERGRSLGLSREDVKAAIDGELARLGAERVVAPPPAPVSRSVEATAPMPEMSAAAVEGRNPFDEFRRILQMSRLCVDGDEMTDDQRDAMCNLGESLGLTGGQAEDLIDEYLDQASGAPLAPANVTPGRAMAMAAASTVVKTPPPRTEPAAPIRPAPREINVSVLARSQERQKYPNFVNSIGVEMLLVTSGQFSMGSIGYDAQQNEQPVTPVTQGCFFAARFPVTNAQYEMFDPAHRNKRAPWADDRHPVIYVSSRDAENFCKWLSSKEGKKYRLPTEAEWEYSARGVDGRIFPWGDKLDAGFLANFADKRTNFVWRDVNIDDGFAETAPVGSFPKGASPFGIEDLAGNVFEWCFDCFEDYKGKERTNPRGSTTGPKRNYRGGSWKSRAASLRATARAFNLPDYSSNDVGFRVICECDPA